MQIGVAPSFGQQFVMRALLYDAAFVHDHDIVGFFDGREPVGDDDGGAVLHQVFQCRLNQPLGFVVQRAGGLIQNQNRRVSQQRAGNGDTLPLPAGKFQSVLADFGLQALRHR